MANFTPNFTSSEIFEITTTIIICKGAELYSIILSSHMQTVTLLNWQYHTYNFPMPLLQHPFFQHSLGLMSFPSLLQQHPPLSWLVEQCLNFLQSATNNVKGRS